MSIFLTGATGFLGRQLLTRFLDEGHEVCVLARDGRDGPARERILAALADASGVDASALDESRARRVHVVPGTLDRPGLGLSAADRDRVLATCDSFVHCGATVRFDLPLAEARRTNVDGTRAVLDLARARRERGPLSRIDYIGTAYVAGRRTDVVHERDLTHDAGHRNTYEQTKYEAETVVRRAQGELPITIHRPSIVVGEAASGRTSSFKMIYWPARIYALGLWRIVPGRESTPLDLIPVDFVADAICALRRREESLGRAFHLAAGVSGAVTLGAMADLLVTLFPERRRARFVDPDLWMRFVHPVLKVAAIGPTRKVIRTGEHYVPYFTQNPRFDNSELAALLAPAGLAIPKTESYIRRLFDYCIETDWGRRPAAAPAAKRKAA